MRYDSLVTQKLEKAFIGKNVALACSKYEHIKSLERDSINIIVFMGAKRKLLLTINFITCCIADIDSINIIVFMGAKRKLLLTINFITCCKADI